MSSSPFDIFRRNLKPLMVLLTGLAMFAFVVLPVLDTYMRRGASTGGDQSVAKFDGITLTSSRVEYFTQNHNATVRFLRELAERTIANGGQPKTAGFNYDAQSRRITSIGINEAPSLQSTVRTLQFAHLAGEQGFALDDIAIQTWLQQFTDEVFSDSQINGLLMESTRNRMGQYHLYEQLRTQLLADIYQRCAFANLSDGQMPLLTPAEQWASFLKLNREATIDAYAVLVNDFLSETNSDPGPTEISAIYDQGKDRDPSDQSPDPAFHRRYTAKFEYLVGDYQTLLTEEIEKLTEEELRAEYERRLKGGDFELPEQEASDDILRQMEAARAAAEARAAEEEARAAEAAEGTGPAESPDDPTQAGDEEPASPATSDEATSDEATSDEATSQSGASGDAKDQAAQPEPKEESSAESASDPESDDASAAESTETPGQQDQSRAGGGVPGVRLVALQNEEQPPTETESPGNEGDADSDEPAAGTPDPDKAADDSNDDDATDSPTSDSPATDTQSSPDEQPEATPTPAASGDDSGDDPPATAADAPDVETFEDVRDRIAEDLAGPEARRRLDVAVQNLTSKMRRYFNERAIYKGNQEAGLDAEEPKPLNLKKLGEEVGFQFESIGPYDEISIADEPISQSREVGTEGMSRGPGFAMMMYGFAGGGAPIAPQPLYSPLRTADDQAGKRYVSWKIAETEARTPELEEVRDEIVMYIRMQEARKLAIARAEELAKQTAESDKPLADLIPEDKKGNLQQGLGPFSWLDQIGFQGATIGNVPELDAVGPEFMKAVFNTELQGYSAAFNQPQRVAYVVRPTSFEPSIEELQRRFKEPAGRMMATFIGGSENNAVIQGFYKKIDEKMNFTSQLQQ